MREWVVQLYFDNRWIVWHDRKYAEGVPGLEKLTPMRPRTLMSCIKKMADYDAWSSGALSRRAFEYRLFNVKTNEEIPLAALL